MLYNIIEPEAPREPRVQQIIDMRELAPWLSEGVLSLSSNIQYIDQYGHRFDDGEYEVGFGDLMGFDDFLLVTLEEGTRLVTGINGLRSYMNQTGQSLPDELVP